MHRDTCQREHKNPNALLGFCAVKITTLRITTFSSCPAPCEQGTGRTVGPYSVKINKANKSLYLSILCSGAISTLLLIF